MSDTLTYTRRIELVLVECCMCAVQYGIPASMDKMLLEKRAAASTCCPNGHQWHYTGQSDAEKLRQARAQIIHEQDQRRAAERQAAAYKGVATKLRTRAAAGVCPCCNRSFENLRRHMTTKHPDFTKDTAP